MNPGMKFVFDEPGLPQTGALVLLVAQNLGLGPAGRDLDAALGGMLERAMKAARFSGKAEETLCLLAPAGLPDACAADRIVLLGLGRTEALEARTAAQTGGAVVAALETSGAEQATVLMETFDGMALSAAEAAAEMAFGARLRSYRFDRYRTQEKPDKQPTLTRIAWHVAYPATARNRFSHLDAVADGVFLTRDLVSEPANVLTPAVFADRCRSLESRGLAVTVLDEAALAAMGAGALMGVAQGSVNPPRLVILTYKGDPEADDPRPLAFVGKGVTFDSGGISIKPASGMEDMKWDMAGAGAVVGLMAALAGRKARINAVGLVGLVENMPSGAAQRPGDVVTSLSGQTIEVINTDAEGRLVLADALTHVQNACSPHTVIDVATLTGAVVVALGSEHAGLFANDDSLAAQLVAAGQRTGERLWRLPLDEAYDKEIRSDIADMKNVAANRNAGSIIGAQFLQRFIKDGVRWAHIDIAGTTWSKKDTALTPKGSTAFGVRLLERFVADSWEAS